MTNPTAPAAAPALRSGNHATCAFVVLESATDVEREACYRLRYDVYIAEQGKPYPDADHAGRRLTDALDQRGIVLAAFDADGTLAGTLRVNFGDDPAFISAYARKLGLATFASLGLSRMSFASRLAVDPARRRTAVFKDLVTAAYRVGAPAGVCLSLCTCRPALVPLFEHLGYEAYGPRFTEEGGGPQRALMLVTRDREHLEAVNSPFAGLAAPFAHDSHTRNWLKPRLAELNEQRENPRNQKDQHA